MNFKNKKFLPVFLVSLFLVSCTDKIIFHFNKTKIVKIFKDHFGWQKDTDGWGSEDDINTWNQIIFNSKFKNDVEDFVSSSNSRDNFKDKEKQWNNILYLPQNFTFSTSVSPIPKTEDELKKFKYSLDFKTPDFKLCYFLNNIDGFSPNDLNNSLLNSNNSQIWNTLFNNYNNLTDNKNLQINIIVEDLLDSSYYLANYNLNTDYSNVQLKNIYFLDKSIKINNLLKNLQFQNKDTTKNPHLNLNALLPYFTQEQIDKIKTHLQEDSIENNFISFFNLSSVIIPPKDKKNLNNNYNLNFFTNWKDNKSKCQNNGDVYSCSVNNFLQTETWESDESFDFFTLYDVDANGKIILIAKIKIDYDTDFGNPITFNVETENFYFKEK